MKEKDNLLDFNSSNQLVGDVIELSGLLRQFLAVENENAILENLQTFLLDSQVERPRRKLVFWAWSSGERIDLELPLAWDTR